VRTGTTFEWNATPKTIETTALVLFHAAAQCSLTAWKCSLYAKSLDLNIGEFCDMIAGYLRAANAGLLFLLVGISHQEIGEEISCRKGRMRLILVNGESTSN